MAMVMGELSGHQNLFMQHNHYTMPSLHLKIQHLLAAHILMQIMMVLAIFIIRTYIPLTGAGVLPFHGLAVEVLQIVTLAVRLIRLHLLQMTLWQLILK